MIFNPVLGGWTVLTRRLETGAGFQSDSENRRWEPLSDTPPGSHLASNLKTGSVLTFDKGTVLMLKIESKVTRKSGY